MDRANKRRMNEALDWMFKELWNTPKDKFEWNAILKKAHDMQKEHNRYNVDSSQV
jgi:hypothetical protein